MTIVFGGLNNQNKEGKEKTKSTKKTQIRKWWEIGIGIGPVIWHGNGI